MVCKECRREKDELLEGLCQDCIYRLAERQKTLSKKDLARVKAAVDAETAGLMAPELVDYVLSGLLESVAEGEARNEAVVRSRVELQRLAGLG